MDTSGQDAFAAALSGEAAPALPETNPQDASPQGGQPQDRGEGHVEQGDGPQPQPEPAPQPAAPPPPAPPQGHSEGIPAWRLREEAEARRALQERYAEAERRLKAYEEAERRQKAEAELNGQDFYGSDPAQYIDQRFQHRAEQLLSPVQQAMQQMQETMRQQTADFSHQMAVQQHGSEKVTQAYQRIQQAIQGRDPTALAIQARVADPRDPISRDPSRAILDWDRRHSVYEATGGDLDKYRQSHADELLKDPAFLARALEAHRQQATPVQAGVPGRAPAAPNRGLPSVNRATSAQSDGDEETDPQAVFNQALATPRR
jgi:hypothetical protein